jgi:ADP-heptose:LPS heptosyltransferase
MRPAEHAQALFAAAAAAASPRPSPRPVRNLLVIGYGAIGDTLFFLPTVQALRAAHPQARLVWLSNPAPVADELIPTTGLADEIWRWDAQAHDPAGRAALNARIASTDFDLAVLSLGAPAPEFIGGLRGIPVVAGHLFPWYGLRRFVTFGDYARRALVNRAAAAPAREHALLRNLRLLDALDVPRPDPAVRPLPTATAAVRGRAAELLDGLAAPIVAVHLGPVGNQYGKMWAPERYADLTRRIAALGRASVVLVGSADPAEAEAERNFRAAGGLCARSLVGKTDLTVSFAVLERCALLVSNDTGVAKAAGALGVPVATIWGLSDPGEVGIPWDKDKHLDVRTGIACSPCARLGTADSAYSYLNCGHRDCLGKLEADFAWRAILERYGDVLDKRPRRPHTPL